MSKEGDKRKERKAVIGKYLGGLFSRTEGYARNVSSYYTAAVEALLDLAATADMNPDEVFRFSDRKRLSAKATNILRGLYAAVYQEIRRGVAAEWEYANLSADAMITSLFGKGVQDDDHFARWFARNREAMDSFFSRKSAHGGLNLSQKVWKYTGQLKDEMEIALSVSLGRGDSAATVSRQVRQYLRDPDRLFRRVRDAEGNLKLSKRAAAFHPGRGEYRSSYKNAMRLTRTETNMAYRAADCDRWSRIPFVVGMEVKRSNHPFGCEVCEALQGKYPKDFVFTGWHPQCRCYIVPMLASEEERIAYHRAVLNGEDVSDFHFNGEITEPHEGFRKWMKENQERIENAQSLPYWMRDNGKYVGNNPKGIKDEIADGQKQVPVGSAAMPSGLGSYEQKEWNDNEMEVSEKLDITQGWPMTHEQADDRHANPNYVAGEKNGYDINCQSCVVAYEMRRRGFDVEALRRIENDPNNGPQRLANDTCSAWIDPKTGKQPSKTNCSGTYFDQTDGKLKVFPIDNVIEKLNAETKEIGRYHLDWTWKYQQNGHAIVAERFKNGGLRLFDPQTGEITSWDKFKNRIYIRNGVNVLRVDELMPNPSVVATVVRTKI